MWRKRVANTLSLGALVWAMTVLVAIVTTVGAKRSGKGWGNAAFAIAIVIGCTSVPWLRAASARAHARRRDRADGTLTIDDNGITRITGKRREADSALAPEDDEPRPSVAHRREAAE